MATSPPPPLTIVTDEGDTIALNGLALLLVQIIVQEQDFIEVMGKGGGRGAATFHFAGDSVVAEFERKNVKIAA